MELCYIYPEENARVVAGLKANPEDNMWTHWLHHMVEANPDVNFFYTTPTTDIFEAEEVPEETFDYSRMYDGLNVNWTIDPEANWSFLKGTQQHMNHRLKIYGVVLLNDVYDALRMPRTKRGAVVGWAKDNEAGDGYIDFGIMSDDPATAAFRNHEETNCLLKFNVDGVVVDYLEE